MLTTVATGLKLLSPAWTAYDLYKNHSQYAPALAAAAKVGGKAIEWGKKFFQNSPEVVEAYKNVSSSLDYLKNHTVSYEAKDGGSQFSGETPASIGQFFKAKDGSWDIFDPKFPKSNPSHIQKLLMEVYNTTSNPDLLQLRVAQILGKKLVSDCSRNLKEGFEITIPVVNSKGTIELAQYTLDRKFNMGEDIPAFGFVDPENKYPPLLIFRPTNLDIQYSDAVSSIIANLHPKGPAWKLYEGSKGELDTWLKTQTFEGRNKARVIGFSQGGILASYMLTYHSPWISQASHKPSFVLDGPGLPEDVARDWHLLGRKPRVWSFVTRGDIVPKVGGELIGDVFEIVLPQKISPLQSHTAVASLAKNWKITEVDKRKEKYSPVRRSFTQVQSLAGKYFYPFLQDYLAPKLKEVTL